MKYSYNELASISQAIQGLLNRSKEQAYSRKLIYGLNKNLRVIQQEMELIEDQFEDTPEGWDEYQQKIQEAGIEAGGKHVEENGQSFIKLQVEGFDKDMFDKAVESLKSENEELIKKNTKVVMNNNKTRQEKLADVEWFALSLDEFPEEMSAEDMPFQLIDLIDG